MVYLHSFASCHKSVSGRPNNLVERILNRNYISKDFRAFVFVLFPKTLNTCYIQFCNLAFAVCTQTYDIVLKYWNKLIHVLSKPSGLFSQKLLSLLFFRKIISVNKSRICYTSAFQNTNKIRSWTQIEMNFSRFGNFSICFDIWCMDTKQHVLSQIGDNWAISKIKCVLHVYKVIYVSAINSLGKSTMCKDSIFLSFGL